MKPIVSVRSLQKNDLPGILRIERKSFDDDAWARDVFLEYASAAPDLFLVARVGARIAGYSIANLARHGAEIASLAVLPRQRRKGVATVLLKATMRRARRAGARTAWLMVRRKNEDAIRLYRQLGFVRVATVANYYGQNAPGWRMKIRL